MIIDKVQLKNAMKHWKYSLDWNQAYVNESRFGIK